MSTTIQNLLNPSIGIQDLMAVPEASRLPTPQDVSATLLNASSLETLYGAHNARSGAQAILCPDVGDGRIVSPEVYQAQLMAIMEKLQKSDNPKIKTLLNEEIIPILQNGMLLSAYRGLMLGG